MTDPGDRQPALSSRRRPPSLCTTRGLKSGNERGRVATQRRNCGIVGNFGQSGGFSKRPWRHSASRDRPRECILRRSKPAGARRGADAENGNQLDWTWCTSRGHVVCKVCLTGRLTRLRWLRLLPVPGRGTQRMRPGPCPGRVRASRVHRKLRLPDERLRRRADGRSAAQKTASRASRKPTGPTSSSSTPARSARRPNTKPPRRPVAISPSGQEPEPRRGHWRLRCPTGRRCPAAQDSRRRSDVWTRPDPALGRALWSHRGPHRDLPGRAPIPAPSAIPNRYRLRLAKTEVIDVEDYEFLTADPRPGDVSVTALVTIQKGCDNYCAYCVVPNTRGREVSRPADEVVAEVARFVSMGAREVTLIGQNVNAYHAIGMPGGDDFAELLRRVNDVPGCCGCATRPATRTTFRAKSPTPSLAAIGSAPGCTCRSRPAARRSWPAWRASTADRTISIRLRTCAACVRIFPYRPISSSATRRDRGRLRRHAVAARNGALRLDLFVRLLATTGHAGHRSAR